MNENIIYNLSKIKDLFFSVQKVEFDQAMDTMNELFNGRISFDIICFEKSTFKYILTTPVKTVCMFFNADNAEEINKKAKECFIKLVETYFACVTKYEQPVALASDEEKQTEDIKETDTVINDIENKQKEMEQANKADDNKITQEQIDFINKFKEEFKIDTDEKFNDYIATWNLQYKTSVRNKLDLARAGRKVVDSFISWIKQSKEAEKAEMEFVTPSSEEVGIPW